MAFAVLVRRPGAGRPAAARSPAGLVQPWADGAVRDVPVLERPPLASLDPAPVAVDRG